MRNKYVLLLKLQKQATKARYKAIIKAISKAIIKTSKGNAHGMNIDSY